MTWQIDHEPLSDGWVRIYSNGQLLALCDPEAARRIIACSNACQHLSTKSLELVDDDNVYLVSLVDGSGKEIVRGKR